MTPTPRYALYFAPVPDSALWRRGCALIGYDAATGQDVPLCVPDGWGRSAWDVATSEPRRYGFHATLKAPFRLAPGRGETELIQALGRFAAVTPPADIGTLVVASLGHCLAVMPSCSPAALRHLAFDVVDAFEPYRAQLSAGERARRRPDVLTPRQRELLDRFGYPYVDEEFRFHMTLAGPLAGEQLAVTRDALDAAMADGLSESIVVDRIALFRQANPNERFRIVAARELAGSPAHRSA
jgi:2'-5' RNA ligase